MTIHDFLIKNGIFPNLKGFNYLIKAVEIVKENPTIKTTKDLYPAIAKAFKDSSQKVERAIRNIVAQKIKIKQYAEIGINKRPTNSELIWYFAVEGGKL